MAEYLYGTYGHLENSVVQTTEDTSTVVLYVGTAPVNLVRGYADAVNKPIKLNNVLEARNLIGTASDWEKYTLSEVVAAHFQNRNGNVGPVYVINVLDPDKHRKTSPTTRVLNFVNGSAAFLSEDIILDTLAIADKAEGTDYYVNYNFTTHKVTITSADANAPLDGAISISYNETDPSLITADDIIGIKTAAGVRTGLHVAELMYQTFGVIVNLFAAPGWSSDKDVYDALVAAATKLNGHWDGFVYADIPVTYGEIAYTYNAVENPTADSNPGAEGWYTLDGLTGAYSLSTDDHLVESAYYTVQAETDTPTTDPKTEEFYEKDGDTYTPSEDTTVDSEKTYYKLTVAAAVTVRGDDPDNLNWYVSDGAGGYIAATDSYVVSGTTYYTRTASTTPARVDTITKAIAWKSANNYTSERSKVFWPMANGSDSNVYLISTLALVETMRIDNSHDGVPMESCGNKAIPVISQNFGVDAVNGGYSVDEANTLTSNGITTLVYWGDSWKIWGDHTAAYLYGSEDMDVRVIFDVSIRMLLYLTNRFQRTWAYTIDKPFTVQLKDTILVREKERLDALVVMGALIGTPSIVFEEANNPLDELRNGNFRWDIQVTPTPPLKSASVYVAYTDAGFSAYFG